MDAFLNAVAFFTMMIFVEGFSIVADAFIHGYTFPKWWPFKKKKHEPLLKAFKVPIIVIKILGGFIFQYLFFFLYPYYSLKWTAKSRTLILSVILLRAGLELDFKGKTIQCVACGVIPVMCEIFMVSAIAHFGMGMRYPFAVTTGFLSGAGSPGIAIPILLNFKMRGMGVENGIVSIMMAAIVIDEIISIIGLGAAQTFAFNEVIQSKKTTQEIILHLIYQILAAIGAGGVGGLLMYPLKKSSNKIKFIPLVTFAIGIIFAFEAANYYESKYLASLIFGYVANKLWHEKAPEHELNNFWKILSPALFGSIGADLNISKVNPSVLGYTFLTIFVGLATKFLAMLLLGFLLFRKSWTKGEILFAASCCLAKAAFQASLGSSVVTMADKVGTPEFIPLGYDILTIAVLYILVAGPIGSISSISLGNKYLTKKAEPHKQMTFIDDQRINLIIESKDIPIATTERQEMIIGQEQDQEGDKTDPNLSSSSSSSGNANQIEFKKVPSTVLQNENEDIENIYSIEPQGGEDYNKLKGGIINRSTENINFPLNQQDDEIIYEGSPEKKNRLNSDEIPK